MAFRGEHERQPDENWDFLAQVFDFLFTSSSPAAPFGPMMVSGDRRTLIPDDLSDEHLVALEKAFGAVDDPEFRARVGDVLWLRRRNAVAAREAVGAYIASGSRLEDPKHWTLSLERYERAIRLARQLGPRGELLRQALQYLEARVLHYDGSDPLYFSLKAMELLDEFAFGDFDALAGIAGRVAQASSSTGDHDRARSYFLVQARLLRRARRTDDAEAARSAGAECLVRDAEAQERGGSFMAARRFWEQAISAFQDCPALRPRLPELRRRLTEAGRRTLDEMRTATSDPIDIREHMRAVRERMGSLSWDDAFFQFAMLVVLVEPEGLRRNAVEVGRGSIVHTLIQADVFDQAGRKIAVRPPLGTGDAEQEEAAIDGLMDEGARMQRHLHVHAVLAPAARVMRDEHIIDEAAVDVLIKDSAFIPEGRLSLFVRAIVAGFKFDFSTALHVLVPQAENALRHVLEQRGVVARNIDRDGVEEVWSVERVLAHREMAEVLGADMVYELRSLLAGRVGPNLRNVIAHGLADENTLNSETGFYLWWVFVRLVALTTDGMAAWIERRRTADAGG
ncbi:DUF4209 domain-containing protein [Methylobacterium sp. J-077]|uniref:DUF4209 domain-containing protein n=1 Tax=Methylobacterium sp. J-077 TaxID=2836656 RepID=UPI001FBADC4F|nr:DUF4209 domain-containing protein [Methylobacterium sp. J-077]MCJ2125710.1 DUF4209 domain-containing protein [Methylobacterium sp. J-077]